MLERSPIGIARVPGLLSRGNDTRFSYALFALVGAVIFFMAAGTQDVFAESALQHARDAPAVTQTGHSYTRAVSDSVGVASMFDNPGSRTFAARTIVRGISDGVGVASEFGSPAGQQATSPATARGYGPSLQPPSQRTDERLGQRILLGNKGEPRIYNTAITQSATPSVEVATEAGERDFNEVATLGDGNGSDPDGHSSRLVKSAFEVSQVSAATQGMIIYSNAVFGVYSFAIIALVAGRSSKLARMRTKTFKIGRGRAALIIVGGIERRQIAVIIAAIAAVGLLYVEGSAIGQAFADSESAGAAYRSNTGTNLLQSVKYREWNPSTLSWSSEVELPGTGSDIRDARILTHPNGRTQAIVSVSADGTLNLFQCVADCTTNTSWTLVAADFADVGAPSTTVPYRYFDIAYEQTSGKLLIVYDKSVSEANDFYYRTFDGTTLSGESGFNYIGGAASDNPDIRYFKMASKPGSNEITMILLDATNLDTYAFIWNGSTFDNQLTVSTALVAADASGESIGVAYETSSGASVVFSPNGNDSAAYARWSGSWSAVSTTDPNSASGNNSKFVSLKSDPVASSHKIMICQLDDLTDLTCREINGGTLSGSSWAIHDTAVDLNTRRVFDYAWDPSGSTGLVVYGTAAGSVSSRTFTSSTNTWSGATTTPYAGTHPWILAARNHVDSDTINSLWMSMNSNFDVGGMTYDGSTLSLISVNTFTADTVVNTFESMDIAFKSREFARSISETVPITDSIVGEAIFVKPVADSMTVGDAISGMKIFARNISDGVTITDTISRSVAGSKSPSDSLLVADSIQSSATIIPDTNLAAISYRSDDGTNTSSSPKYREWNLATKTWGPQIELESAGSPIRNAWIEFSPISSKRVIIVLSDDGSLDSYVCDNGCTDPTRWVVNHDFADLWSNAQNPSSTAPAAQKRPFDIEFANTSGDLMIVYDKANGGNNHADLFYRIMRDSSTSFGSENSLDDTGSLIPDNVYSFVRLDSRRTSGSNDLALIALSETNNRAEAWYWNGTTETFGNEVELTTTISTVDYEAVGIGFETFTGNLMAVYGVGGDVKYRYFSSGSWGSEGKVQTGVSAIDVGTVRWIRLVPNPNPGTSGIFLGVSGYDGSVNLLDSAYWDGTAWQVYSLGTRHDASIDTANTRTFDFMWDNSSDSFRGILAWGNPTDQITFKRYAAPNTWTANQNWADAGTHNWISLNEHSNPTTSDPTDLLGAALDSANGMSSIRWDGGANNPYVQSNDGITTAGAPSPESFHVDYRRSALIKKFLADTVATSDSISIKRAYGMGETVSIGDSIAKVVVKKVADTVTPADSISANRLFTRSISETQGISDSQAIVLRPTLPNTIVFADSIRVTHGRFISDTVAVTDTAARNNLAARNVSDSIAVTDLPSTLVSLNASPSDAVATSDMISTIKVFSRSASDSLTLSDVASRNGFVAGMPSDAASVTDSVNSRIAAKRPASDSLTMADSIQITYAAARGLSDSIAILDAISAKVTARDVSDSLTVTDTIVVQMTGRSISDSLSVVDTLSAKITARAASDALAVTDTIVARITASSALISDALSTSDSITAKVTRRAVTDDLPISDSIDARITATSATASDTLSVTDSISAKVTARAISDALSVTDSIAARISSRSAYDSLSVTDAVSARISARAVADFIAVTDDVSARIGTKAIADSLAVIDRILAQVTARALSDTVGVTDTIAAKVSARVARDSLAITDTLTASVNFTIADSASVSDSIAMSITRRVQETLSASDTLEGSGSIKRSASESISLSDSISMSISRAIVDSLAVTDTAKVLSLTVNIADSVATTDRVVAESIPILGDSLTLADTISIQATRSISDSLSIGESLGLPIMVSISDIVAVQDAVRSSKTIAIADSLGVNAQVTNLSVQWNRSFDETLGMQDCTPFSCNPALNFNEKLDLVENDFFTSPPGRIQAETLTVTDVIAVNRPQTFISLDDQIGVDVLIKPLLPILVNETPEKFGAPPATEKPGVQNWDGTPTTIRDALELEPLYFNVTYNRNNLENNIITLRPHQATFNPTAELPGTGTNDVIVSDWAANIPANTPVQMVVNFKDTPALDDHADFISDMKLSWTPNYSTTNFGLVVSVIDGPPAGQPQPVEELKPLFLDVSWWGNFAGAPEMDREAYYRNPPTFTFTVNDDWVRSQEASVDENGVPDLKLWLLDDSGHRWDQIVTLTKPAQGVDGKYTFTATLPHFSNYAVTATKAPTSSSRPPVAVPPLGSTLVADLAESMSIGDSQKAVPIEITEEFGQKKLVVSIADSVAVLTRPVSYKTFQVGDVNVKITVQDVKQESIVPPKATATFLVEMENSGNKDEKFTLNFWYYDETGKKPYESSQLAELGPHESKQVLVDVPFTSPGVFEVTAEARSFPDNKLVNAAQLTVTIPWLTINLYVLVVVAVVILGASGAVLALLLSRMGVLAAGGAGLLALLLLKKPKPKVRVTENIEGIEDYDLLVQVRPKDGTHVQMSPASLDTEIVNRSRGKQTFVLSYWAMDESGVRMREKSDKITIGARKTIRMAVSLDLPEGTYIFAVEAKPTRGDDVWSHTRLRIRVL